MQLVLSVVALGWLLMLAAGCSSALRPEVLQAWVGRPATALQQDWGPPTREIQDGAQRILVYEQLERRSGGDFQSPRPSRTVGTSLAQTAAEEAYRNPTVYVRSYLFWVNAEGVIVRADVRQP